MKLLIINHRFPEYDTNSGDLRMFEFMKILLAQGHEIAIVAKSGNDIKYKKALEDLGVKSFTYSTFDKLRLYLFEFIRTLLGRGPRGLEDLCLKFSFNAKFKKFLKQNPFDVGILPFYYNYCYYAPFIRRFFPHRNLILDTVDLHFLREKRQAELLHSARLHKKAEKTRRREFEALQDADSVWVVTRKEKDILNSNVLTKNIPVHVVPNIHRKYSNLNKYDKRDGIIFVGGYDHPPNVDAVDFFMKKIYPMISRSLPGVKITIAGNKPPRHFRKYDKSNPNVTVTGFVGDLRSVLNSHRIAIAPLRFGAGMKGKIGEYMCCGLPCVTTSIGAEGFGFKGNELIIEDDPKEFAKGIIKLYKDRDLWNNYSREGINFMKRYTPEVVSRKLKEVLAKYLNGD